jgi:hypothetical protein
VNLAEPSGVSRVRTAVRAGQWFVVVVGIALFVVAWPVRSSLPGIGLDGSFVTGLHLAFRDGLDYGEEIVYAYGPLGFLAFSQPYYGVSSALAFGATALLVITTTMTLVDASSRLAGFAVGAALAFVAAHLMGWSLMWELFGALAILWTLRWLLDDDAGGAAVDRRLAVLGLLAALGLLGKFNIGLLLSGTGLIAALAMPMNRPRGLAVFGLALAGSLTIAWLLLGQDPQALGAYLRLSFEIAAGYSSAMGVQAQEPPVWQVGLAVAAIGILAEMLLRASSAVRWPRRLATFIVLAAYAFAYFKAGFVRWDAHVNIFFVSVPLVAFAFVGATASPIGPILRIATLIACFLFVSGTPPVAVLNVEAPARELIDQVGTLASPDARRARVTAAIEHLQSQYGFSPELVDMLRGRSVHIDSAEAGVAYAYPGIEWRPLPIFQSFSAYTAPLDDANAEFLRSARAPERILRLAPAPIDGRNPWFDSPEAVVEWLCRYRQITGSPVWQHVADRCTAPERQISVHQALPGDLVEVPAVGPGEMLLLRVTGLYESAGDRLEVLVWKADDWTIEMDAAVHRLIPGAAGQPLLLTPPYTAGPAAGYLMAPPTTVRITSRPMLFGPSMPLLTFAFSALPIDVR